MKPNDSYYADLLLAWLLRLGLLGGILAIVAGITACSIPLDATNILPKMSASRPPLGVGEDSQTRNYDTPQSGGCNEKSDSSLKRPLS
jgi:hypothetical protein